MDVTRHHLSAAFRILPGALFALAVCGCHSGDKNHGPAERVLVVTQHVEKAPVAREISLSGNVEGRKTVKLGFMVSGRINFVACEEGRTIKAGQLLASLDPESYQIGVDLADAGLRQVRDEYDRLKQMHDRQSLSESDFTKITTTLAQVQAQHHLASKNLTDTKLIAPISGVLLKRGVEPGEIIGQGMPLFVLSDIATVKVTASVPESDIRFIRTGQSARVFISALDSSVTGTVREIGAAADPVSRTFSIDLEVPNHNLLLRPGMIAEIKITVPETMESLAVPGEAVQRDESKLTYVYVVDIKQMQAYRRLVTVGRLLDTRMEILSGLKESDIVVVGGQQKLQDGTPIVTR
jgi:membrane fusion protein, multidrug efflux system